MGSFAAALEAFADEVKGKIDDVVNLTVHEVRNRLVIRSPVDTGRFRNNWQIGIDAVPNAVGQDVSRKSGKWRTRDGRFARAPQMSVEVKGAGHVYYVANNLPYANRLEFGFTGTDRLGRHYNQAPLGFVALTATEIPQIFAAAIQAVKS